MTSTSSMRPELLGTEPPRSWTPASVGRAFAGGSPRADALARALLVLLPPLAARELIPWSGHYRRSPASLGEDIVQDVMLKLFAEGGRVLRAWDPERGLSLRGFLRRVVRFHVLQLFRSSAKNPWRDRLTESHLEVADEDSDAILHQLWLWEVRDLLLAEESDHGRALYIGLFVEHRSAEDVGEQHNMSRDAVYQWRSRFKRRASRLLSAGQQGVSRGAT
ncbi:MAG: sigma-70 family RNA polymerase sigma factor [Nannocystaceae bacterium]|nr:sigma-70 family RNA polymerase sigma factor [Nannocystaceae bacterium]